MFLPTAKTAFLNKPIIITSSHSPKAKPTNFRISKLNFSREFLFPGFLYTRKGTWVSKIMDNPIKISSFISSSDGVDDEFDGVVKGALEQEGLIDGSSQSSSNRFESILNSMSKWLGTAVFVALVLIRHDSKVLWGAMGSVINVLICNLLKKVIKQERPVSSLKPDPGMPSSHAQSLFFIFLFAIISMIEYFGVNPLTIPLSGLTLAIASYLSWLRVSQKFHTISQVVVGAGLGSSFCIFWFWTWDSFMQETFASYLWVRILVLLGAAGFGIGFFVHVIRHWIFERN